MTYLSKDLSKLRVLVVTALLLVSSFAFIPAVSAFSTPAAANTGPSPASLSGTTATIDSSALIGFNTTVIRTLTVTNPIGNPAITALTVSVPTAAFVAKENSSTACPATGALATVSVVTYATPCGGIPADSGVPSAASATIATYGSGPWAVVYSAASGKFLLPGGAAIKLQISVTTELSATTAGAADSYSLSLSATDSTGAQTNLNAISVYEGSGSVTLKVPTTNETAGTIWSAQINASTAGLPLTVSSNSSTTTTISPATFTSTTGVTTVSVNDTLASNVTLSVSAGKLDASDSANGGVTLTAQSTSTVKIVPGPITGLAVTVSGIKSTGILNISTSVGLAPIPSANISVSTADKFGNAVVSGGSTSLTLTANTYSGQPAGFSTASAYGGTYPYAPTPAINTSLTLTILNGQSTVSLSTAKYFFGVDYGSQSQLVATTSSGLATGFSAMIKTYALSATAPTVFPSTVNVNVKAGATQTINATLAIAQKNVPIMFGFSTTANGAGSATYAGSYTSTGTNTTSTLTTINSNNQAVASATVMVATTLNAAAYINATETLNPTTNASAAFSAFTLVTQAGALAKLTVLPYFAASSGSQQAVTYAISGASVYVNVTATDAYGNLKTVTGDTQLTMSVSAGTLSITSPVIYSGTSSTNNSGFSILVVAPSTVGTVVTVKASGIASGVVVSGSASFTVVSSTPLLSASGPTTWTSGIPSAISGTANASLGVLNNKIQTVQYSVNGGSKSSVAVVAAANVAFSFSILLTGPSNINITVTDSAGNQNWQVVQIPIIPASQTFNASSIAPITFTNGPKAVNATYTNNGAATLTVIVVANVLNSQGAIIEESTATITVASGASASGYPIIQGIAPGTYTVQVTVYSLAYVTLSNTTSISVTV